MQLKLQYLILNFSNIVITALYYFSQIKDMTDTLKNLLAVIDFVSISNYLSQ